MTPGDKAPTTATTPHGGTPLVWVHVGHVADAALQKALVTTALEQGLSHVVVPADAKESLVSLGRFEALVRHPADEGPGDRIIGEDGPRGRWVTIRDKHDEADVSALAGAEEVVVVAATDWKIIPLENLIADYQPTATRLLAEVATAEEAEVMLDTLEVGTDGVVLSPEDPQEIIDLAARLAARTADSFALQEAEIVAVRDAGKGDRVCVDTCSLLAPGEGMLVGGAAKGLFLIHSESLESPYVNARPFRVNAGAVYAYVMGTGGRTHYLSEVESGMPLTAVDHTGRARRVTVGRAKVETRPLLLVEARPVDAPDDVRHHVVVQNAETIRFVTPDGGALSVVDARPGDRVLLWTSEAGRHFGRAIKENLVER